MAKAHILIVEDNIDEATYLKDALTILDYTVVGTVLSGEDALLRISQGPTPDVILMDILLEGEMDGIEAAKKIHAVSTIPIIYLTAHDEEEFLNRAGSTDPFGFLLKPFSSRELHSTIEIALYKHRTEEALQHYREQLETLVKRQTAELSKAGTQLQKEAEERHSTEEAFANEHNLLRTLIDTLPDYIFVKDKEQRFILNNTSHTQLLGASSPEELYGKRDRDILPNELTAQYDSSDRDVLESGNALINREEVTIDRQGQKQYLLTTKIPLRDRDGKIAGLIGVGRDITTRKHTELELRAHEELLRATLESTADGILVIDKEGRITHLNDRLCEMWRIPRETLEGRNERLLLDHAQPQLTAPQTFFRAFRELHDTKRKESDVIACHDGRVFERFSSPLIRAGEVAGRVWSFRDISEYKRVEKELHTYREHLEELVEKRTTELQTVIETVGEGITLSNDAGEFKIFNSEMEALTGYTKEEANRSGDFLGQLYPELKERQKAFLGLVNVKKNGQIRDLETTIRSKDGSRKTLLVSSSLVKSEGSESYLSAYHDITHRKQAERDLQQAKEAAETANRAKSEFLANMSHELRTPLNAILGYTQILRQGRNLSERQLYSIEVMQRSGEHLLMLINDILDLSKIEAQKLELSSSAFQLADFLESIVEMTKIRAQQKGIVFEFLPSDDLPEVLRADTKRLRQVLLNLLSNGVKFTDFGKVRFLVSLLRRDARQADIRFEVADTGAGIPHENVHDIFFPFYQIEKTSHTEGTGLGLAISQRLIRMMGGQLEVNSTPGQGSLFWFDLTLPLLPRGSTLKPQRPAQENTIVGFYGPPFTILIADDNEINRTLLKELLSPLGFQTIEAVDGVDTLQKAGEFRPDLILLDLIMPQMDGFEVVRQLKASPELQNILVLAISASVFEDTRQKSLEAGCDDFIAKPMTLKGLLGKLHSHLKLEWKYETPPTPEAMRPLRGSSESYELPSPEEIQQLLELATSGHIKKLLQTLEGLQESSPHTEPFLLEIQRMAQGFQMKQMCAFLRQYAQ